MNHDNVVGFIAARMASTRFPNKPLTPIAGMPMLGHVLRRSEMATQLDEVWTATCDQEIVDYVATLGGTSVMTLRTHERATDRIAEALAHVERQTARRVDVALLIQGDEPLLDPAMLDALALTMRNNPACEIANLMSPIESVEEFEDPNTVKVVINAAGQAMYLSREPIPSRTKHVGPMPMWKQLGLIAFRRDALVRYAEMPPTPLEIIESVDVNRWLERGRAIQMVPTAIRTAAVDVPADVERVEMLMASDPLRARYG